MGFSAGVADRTDQVKALGEGLLMNEINSWRTGVNRNIEGKRCAGSCATAAATPNSANVAKLSWQTDTVSSRWLRPTTPDPHGRPPRADLGRSNAVR
jgi:hypothetical protein